MILFICSSISLKAQWSGTNPLTTNSDVGISTSSPTGYLHISPSYSGGMYPATRPLFFADYNWFGTQVPVLCAMNTGKVGIGTASPTSTCHVLGTTLLQGNTDIQGNTNIQGNTVIAGTLKISDGVNNQFEIQPNGFVKARQVDVNLDVIPDYVFHNAFSSDSAAKYKNEGTYSMLSLEEIDTFVQINRHLPGIKSASEYQNTGSINIGELQLQLLQKIEELTLYNIQLQKEINELKKLIR